MAGSRVAATITTPPPLRARPPASRTFHEARGYGGRPVRLGFVPALAVREIAVISSPRIEATFSRTEMAGTRPAMTQDGQGLP
jgi:hypothetical protein